MFFQPVTDISEKYTMLQSAMAGGEKVFKLMDTNEQIPDTVVSSGISSTKDVQGFVEFNDVYFE
jgi:ABC-type multidrug transport system fused ATPase/permease subunit